MAKNSSKSKILLTLSVIILVFPLNEGHVILFPHYAEKGQTITLGGDFGRDKMPHVDHLTWWFNGSLVPGGCNGTIIAMMERVSGTPFWEGLAPGDNLSLEKNGSLTITNADKNNVGNYIARSENEYFAAHDVLLFQPGTKEHIAGVKYGCKEGEVIKCYFAPPAHPGRKILIRICRIWRTQDLRKRICDADAVDHKMYVDAKVESGQPIEVVFEDTTNKTIKATSDLFVQFLDRSDSHDPYNPQMARLSTKTEASNSTQNPESKSSQQSPNEGTTDGLENRVSTTQSPKFKSDQQATNEGTTEGEKKQDESTTMQSPRSVTPSQTRVSNTEEQVAPTPSQATATTKGPFRTTKGNDGIFVVSRPTSDRDRDYVIGLCTGVLIVLGVGAIVILCVILYRRYRKRRERQSDQYQRTMASASERLVYSLQL